MITTLPLLALKPAESASLSLLRLAELGLEAGLPPGVLQVVTGYGSEAGQAIALFYRFRRDFQNKFDRFDSPFEPFIEDYENNLKRSHASWFPSCVTADVSILKRSFLIVILGLQAIILWRFMNSRQLIRKLLLIIVLNGALLAIAGTLQKLSYVPGDRVKRPTQGWSSH